MMRPSLSRIPALGDSPGEFGFDGLALGWLGNTPLGDGPAGRLDSRCGLSDVPAPRDVVSPLPVRLSLP
ncbi:MAG: hypothetical protein ACRDTU_20575, partial [Micromonosporaceae bacterium]